MFPIQLAGIALAGRALLSRYNSGSLSNKGNVRFALGPRAKFTPGKTFTAANPLKVLSDGLTSALSRIAGNSAKEDYYTVVKSFLPAGTKLISPQFPLDSREIELADVDGDSHKELIASYKQNDGIKTVIMKKQNGQWLKAAEIVNSEYDTINCRDTADITGDGKKQLLLGMSSAGKTPTLYGYSLDNGAVSKLFSRNYHKFEVIRPRSDRNEGIGKTQLAIWDKKDTGIYGIELLGWNGKQLEASGSNAAYYYKNVVPYYIKEINRAPHTPLNWYSLADALTRAGIRSDASIAVDVGVKLDRNSEFKDRFIALKNEIYK